MFFIGGNMLEGLLLVYVGSMIGILAASIRLWWKGFKVKLGDIFHLLLIALLPILNTIAVARVIFVESGILDIDLTRKVKK